MVFQEIAGKVAIDFFSEIKIFENTAFGYVTEVPTVNITIVIRNAKIAWKHGPNRPLFLYNLSSENY